MGYSVCGWRIQSSFFLFAPSVRVYRHGELDFCFLYYCSVLFDMYVFFLAC